MAFRDDARTCGLLVIALVLTTACGDDEGAEPVEFPPDAGIQDLAVSNDASPTDATVEPDPFVATWDSLADRPCPEDSILTYENFGHGFMLSWCSGCHSTQLAENHRAGAPVGIDLDSHQAVLDQLDRIWVRSGDNNQTMPPAGGLSDELRFMLGEWLGCGAP